MGKSDSIWFAWFFGLTAINALISYTILKSTNSFLFFTLIFVPLAIATFYFSYKKEEEYKRENQKYAFDEMDRLVPVNTEREKGAEAV